MTPIYPSFKFLLAGIIVTIILVIISQKAKRFERFILSFIWVAYIIIMLGMTIPSSGECTDMTIFEKFQYAPPWNSKPFSLLKGQFMNMLDGQSGAARQFLGNIILFIPAGFFPPMLFPKFRKWYGLFLPGFIWSLCIEVSQLVLNLANLSNRTFDTDDIILNVFGAMIGFIVYKIFFAKKHRNQK
ncbi:MAG: VanZ family protein [Eubacteriales bacterium]